MTLEERSMKNAGSFHESILSRVLSSSRVMVAVGILLVLAAVAAPLSARASDIEAGAWPEFDIWISLDEAKKNRIYILNSWTEEPNYAYEETVLGISWDQRFHKHWSWRAGIRYIWKQVDPPDVNETRVVLDLKWFQPLGKDWMLSDRNRIDLRWLEGKSSNTWRYRNRIQLEKPFPVFSRTWTGFGSYELYYDSRYDTWGQRHRLIGGVSVPVTDWASVDVFYGYHVETKPKDESAGALGIAFGFFFNWDEKGFRLAKSAAVPPANPVGLPDRD